jgi:flagellar basal body rod protein FlgF
MVEMIELSKHYDLQVKAMKTADDDAAAAAGLTKLA